MARELVLYNLISIKSKIIQILHIWLLAVFSFCCCCFGILKMNATTALNGLFNYNKEEPKVKMIQ